MLLFISIFIVLTGIAVSVLLKKEGLASLIMAVGIFISVIGHLQEHEYIGATIESFLLGVLLGLMLYHKKSEK